MRLLPIIACALGLALVGARAADPSRPARRVVVVVFDGMRPDFVTPELTPHLWRLASGGTFFAHHHPVFVCATEVNGTALGTGSYPARSSVIANTEFRPAIDPQQAVAIQALATIRRGDEASGGRFLGAPTVAELLHLQGMRTVIAGSKPVALLLDRATRADNPDSSPVLFEGSALPAGAFEAVLRAEGPFPPISAAQDKQARDRWTTRALIGPLWGGGVPAYTVLWLAEPDFSQHATGPGSRQSLAAIKSSDANLGLVLAELDRRGLRGSTDVLVVSDHGFTTVGAKVDVAVDLSTAGFHAARAALGGLRPGAVLVVGQGGSSLIYVGADDPEVCRRLAAYIQVQDWCGVVFSRQPWEGTFPLAAAHLDSPQAPDLIVSLRWVPGSSKTGAPGLQTSDLAPTSKEVGSHASLSPYDMHNILIAAGPDIRTGVTDTLPSGNTDLAPTILWILGLQGEALREDGRVLSEALRMEAPALKSYELKRLTARRQTAGGAWNQYLQVSEVNGVRYLDEGNGAFTVGASVPADEYP